mmetsp:Transcript_42407/g.101118  ORF Transcript_42407/g.101118 Transcript_42407/m.101118 type:complete len:306 (-) Transcript_42407:774-1691(-)
MQLLIPLRLVPTLEVCRDDLPVSCRLFELLLCPLRLASPGVPHELEAIIQVLGPARGCAVSTRRILGGSANVVIRICTLRMGIHSIGVQHEDLHGKLRILHPLHEVLAWHDPSIAGPGIGDLLVPRLVELEAPVVVVAEYTEPWLSVHAIAGVDFLEDLCELVCCHRMDLVHRRSAGCVHTSPVEVVSHVDVEVRLTFFGELFHGGCHIYLRPIVRIGHVVAGFGARFASKARPHRVSIAPSSPAGHCMRTIGVTALVLDHLTWVSSNQASPVADGKHVVLLLLIRDLHGWPSDAVVLLDLLRGL